MINRIQYKKYVGTVEYTDEDGIFHGKVLGIRGLISYEGKDIEDLKKDFHNAVDDYLNYCDAKGIKPQAPFKGSFNVRVEPELHRIAVEKAQERGISLNKLVNNALTAYLL